MNIEVYERENGKCWYFRSKAFNIRKSTKIKVDASSPTRYKHSKKRATQIAAKILEAHISRKREQELAMQFGNSYSHIKPIKLKDMAMDLKIHWDRRAKKGWKTALQGFNQIVERYGDYYIYHQDPQQKQITKAVCLEHEKYQAKQNLSPITRSKTATTFQRIVGYALLNEHWPEDRVNPINLIRDMDKDVYNQERATKHNVIPTELMETAIQNAEREDDKLLWKLLFYTGLDVGDAVSLTDDNVLSDRIVKIRAKNAHKNQSTQIIPIHPSLKGMDLTAFEGSTHRSKDRFQRHNNGKRCKKRVGVAYVNDSGYCFKCLRHTFATNLQNAFYELGYTEIDSKPLIGLALGHQDKTVTDIYIHRNGHTSQLPEDLIKAVNLLPSLD